MAESEKAQRVSDSFAEGEEIDSFVTDSRTGCYCFPCFGSRRPDAVGFTWSEKMREIRSRSEPRRAIRDFVAMKKVREWSEIVAGPRWKTFIRRFNRSKNPGARQGKFQYDPLSYALNFDDGLLNSDSFVDDLSDYGGFRNSSVQCASASLPPADIVPCKKVELVG